MLFIPEDNLRSDQILNIKIKLFKSSDYLYISLNLYKNVQKASVINIIRAIRLLLPFLIITVIIEDHCLLVEIITPKIFIEILRKKKFFLYL